MKAVGETENELKQQLYLLKKNMDYEFKAIEKSMRDGFAGMRKYLSDLRRESGMGIKVNKAESEEMK